MNDQEKIYKLINTTHKKYVLDLMKTSYNNDKYFVDRNEEEIFFYFDTIAIRIRVEDDDKLSIQDNSVFLSIIHITNEYNCLYSFIKNKKEIK